MGSLARFDVTPSQMRAVRVLSHHGGVRSSELAQLLHITPRSVTEVVDALEAKGLAARSPDPGPLQTQAAAILRDRLPVIPIFTYAAPMLIAPDLRGVARGDAMTGWSGQDIWRAAE